MLSPSRSILKRRYDDELLAVPPMPIFDDNEVPKGRFFEVNAANAYLYEARSVEFVKAPPVSPGSATKRVRINNTSEVRTPSLTDADSKPTVHRDDELNQMAVSGVMRLCKKLLDKKTDKGVIKQKILGSLTTNKTEAPPVAVLSRATKKLDQLLTDLQQTPPSVVVPPGARAVCRHEDNAQVYLFPDGTVVNRTSICIGRDLYFSRNTLGKSMEIVREMISLLASILEELP